ncbi:DNA helicase/exodeoxyribonuclease V, subunit A [Arboricoccus pini]|uniref:DNA 3'-5' helicase n=1 Tax=Arboricoccus pini TaxID=1963835 RepID=A0A212QZT0_9PROT|nr:double-strand break repair helicase AddA [Arboricoccus pini]SNB65252.1 DNA helicase/exodeoxyribonuclease V, subunit A [Arboricoccus pini]
MTGSSSRIRPTPEQMRSADPKHSVWVTANAGTGKTRVLSDRILRLLLAGARPESILAITFTKAAAAEMIARVEAVLSRWATMPDERELTLELADLSDEEVHLQRVRQARRLFAQVLDLPKGLPIMTIHALSTALLRRFPIEAGVAPHFETIDDRTASEMMIEAREEILTLAQNDDGPLARALDVLATSLSETSLTSAIQEMLDQRVRLERALERHSDLDDLIASIYRRLDADPTLQPADILLRACRDGEYDAEGLAQLVAALRTGSKTQLSAAVEIATWLSMAAPDRLRSFEANYKPLFLKADNGPRGDVLTKKLRERFPAEANVYDREQARVSQVFARVRGLFIARRTEAMLRVGFAAIQSYERQKSQRAALDFEDLIERARKLLASPDRTEWVLFKLDERIAHLLVDEAQDTSPAQWDLVERLTEDFFSGEGAHTLPRTLFVVGDEKQSIYSFQGADLVNFRSVRDRIAERAANAGKPMHVERIERSFRSSRAVLELVDAVYANPEVRQGVTDAAVEIRHQTQRVNDAGQVELWPLVEPDDQNHGHETEDAWPLPGGQTLSHEANRRLAEAIVDRVQGWLETKERLAHAGRPIRPGDILILLQQRGTVQDLLVRAFKRRNVPVAGADRLNIITHIAVADLLALGNAMLLPEDDLTLGCLLKSPLVGSESDLPADWGLSEEELFALAHGREQQSLLERLRQFAEGHGGRYGQVYGRIREWLRRADFMPPYEFFVRVLGEDGGRRRLLARLGSDALEPIEAFLSQALAYEEGHPASLQGFVYWLRQDERQIKRDPEQSQDAVRVMTVHGSKGLEAPIVILADAGPRQNISRSRLLWDPRSGLPFWRPNKEEREDVTGNAIAEQDVRSGDERRRLLYVALTRARDRLYVTGWQPRKKSNDSDWHSIVETAMRSMPGVESLPLDWVGQADARALRISRGVPATYAAASEANTIVDRETSIPPWLYQPAREETTKSRPLAPSHQSDDEPTTSSLGDHASHTIALRRGVLVHTLLGSLPSLPASERSAATEIWLRRRAAEMPAEERAGIAKTVMRILKSADLEPIFANDAFVEQPIVGVVGEVAVSGQIDRMAIRDREIILVDFKTGTAPSGDRAPPLRYLKQMQSYKALLAQLYPDKQIRCALVWTDTGVVSWLSDVDLSSAPLRPFDRFPNLTTEEANI